MEGGGGHPVIPCGRDMSPGGAGEHLGRVSCCKSGSSGETATGWGLGLGLPRGTARSGKGQGQVTLDHLKQPRSPVTGRWRGWEGYPPSCPPTRDSARSVHGRVQLGSPWPGSPRELLGARGGAGRPSDPVPLSVPDSLILKVLNQRLSQHDCVHRGWVLHGFPRDLDQARLLDSLGHKPNR